MKINLFTHFQQNSCNFGDSSFLINLIENKDIFEFDDEFIIFHLEDPLHSICSDDMAMFLAVCLMYKKIDRIFELIFTIKNKSEIPDLRNILLNQFYSLTMPIFVSVYLPEKIDTYAKMYLSFKESQFDINELNFSINTAMKLLKTLHNVSVKKQAFLNLFEFYNILVDTINNTKEFNNGNLLTCLILISIEALSALPNNPEIGNLFIDKLLTLPESFKPTILRYFLMNIPCLEFQIAKNTGKLGYIDRDTFVRNLLASKETTFTSEFILVVKAIFKDDYFCSCAVKHGWLAMLPFCDTQKSILRSPHLFCG